jgi:hypothetical protein
MSSSREDAVSRLRQWEADQAPISASFVGRGLSIKIIGRLVFSGDGEKVWVAALDDDGGSKPLLTLVLSEAVHCETFEPLRDAPADALKMDFFAAEAFIVSGGYLDLREVAGAGQ